MLKRIMGALLSIAIAVSGIAGFASVVSANNDEYYYTFYNGSSSGNTTDRKKTSNKLVYVHPTSGPSLYVTIQGKTSSTSGSWHNRSTRVTVYNGYTHLISSTVHSHSETRARLHLERTSTAYTYSKGYWNPEPTY